ncbi:hypothetical protein [Rhizobium sp. BG6]|uniref:hypothetical protein n=1 Tax=Rhizobium sp. BG6 TaxID=2613771 RepID=UPI00193EA394|nr:hypothetical protein [Rhizobium sp. BG6]
MLTTSAASGTPAIIEAEGGLVCLIAIDDLVEIVMESGPSLAEVMDKARVR